MAELATIARPYAEALFEATPAAEAAVAVRQISALAALTDDGQLRQFADSPKVTAAQVFDLIIGLVTTAGEPALGGVISRLLQAVIDNGRLAALPEIAAQFQARVNARGGVSDAVVHSAFPIEAGPLAGVVTALEKRFDRKLNVTVELDPSLIGGIRVVVGDEVLDTSVKARLEQMKVALTA
jgi:F-type H+-transporting ATPase subunit delta